MEIEKSGSGPHAKTTAFDPTRPRTIFQEKIMTAVLYDDVVTTPARQLTPAPASKQASKRLHRPPTTGSGDPLVDATARLLSIPLRQVYAVLWRVGLIEVRA
jgi:hypothetical protein